MKKKIKHSKEWYYWAYMIAYWVGMGFCIVPTLVAAGVELPIIVVKEAESTLSGVFIVAIVAAALPLYKALIKLLKSPSAAVICWILFGLMFLVNRMQPQTIHGLTVVFMWAAIGNTLGVICFKLSALWKELWRDCGQVEITAITEALRGEKQ